MINNSFYNDESYKKKQSKIARSVWEKRLKNFKYKRDKRKCKNKACDISFEVIPSDKRVYCSKSCSNTCSNLARGAHSVETRKKISKSLTGRLNPQGRTITLVDKSCKNSACTNIFKSEPWKKQKYCSNKCAMKVIGGKSTSPKASRGKAGIRKDISTTAYFHSRWEANIARLFNYLNIKWEYEPKMFDIGEQMYTPDFYLPETDTYIEVKNFWNDFSKERDTKFRKTYPDVKLKVILKEDYLKLQDKYAKKIPKWEYNNSKFE